VMRRGSSILDIEHQVQAANAEQEWAVRLTASWGRSILIG